MKVLHLTIFLAIFSTVSWASNYNFEGINFDGINHIDGENREICVSAVQAKLIDKMDKLRLSYDIGDFKVVQKQEKTLDGYPLYRISASSIGVSESVSSIAGYPFDVSIAVSASWFEKTKQCIF